MVPYLLSVCNRLSESGSEDQYHLIRSWIKSCDGGHPNCKLSDPCHGFLPSGFILIFITRTHK